MRKINQILIFVIIILISCEQIYDTDPTYGCHDMNACNYDPVSDNNEGHYYHNDYCIYPEYGECFGEFILDECGFFGDDTGSCYNLSYISSVYYYNSECDGNSIPLNDAEIELSILDHTNLIMTGTAHCVINDTLQYLLNRDECDTLDGHWVENLMYSTIISDDLENTFPLDSIMIMETNSIIDNDTLIIDSELIFHNSGDTLYTTMTSQYDYGCLFNYYYSLENFIYGSFDNECCNYNEYSLIEMECDSISIGRCDCDDNIMDCNGECGGDAVEDECGVCNGEGTVFGDSGCCEIFIDCDGICYGTNLQDCNGECGGDAVEDECGVCNGEGAVFGDSGCCEIDIDECGICNGNGIQENECDCNGNSYVDTEGTCCDINSIDDCGMCMEDYVSTILEYEDWIILWEDHFLDETINPDNWNLEYWEPGRYNDELQAYTPRPENAYIEDGNLIIQALREDYTYIDYNTGLEIPAEFTSARLNTKLKSDFQPMNCGPFNGGEIKIDIRAKLPDGDGTWPAIWLLPTYDTFGQWPSSGEIDIMEHGPGVTGDNVILSSVHTQEFNFNVPGYFDSGNTNSEYIENANSEYIIYSIIWSTNSIIISANGVEILNYENVCNGYVSWPFSESFHIILNLAIGGDLGGNDIDNNMFPQKFYIDYVSVSQNSCYQNDEE